MGRKKVVFFTYDIIHQPFHILVSKDRLRLVHISSLVMLNLEHS